MEEIKLALAKLQDEVHIIDRSLAVLTTKFLSLDSTINHLADTVKMLSDELQQAHGMAKLVRLVWVIIGMIIAGCSAVLTYMHLHS